MNTRLNNKKGFTIIEVVLVLAIAALIFLIVFLAVPALQRSQRDTQRRTDLGRLQTSITNYTSNHQGSLPTVNNAFLTKYLRSTQTGDKFQDPKLGDYNITAGSASLPTTTTAFNDSAANGTIYYMSGGKCNDDGTFTGGGQRSFAVSIVLESGDLYCQNS